MEGKQLICCKAAMERTNQQAQQQMKRGITMTDEECKLPPQAISRLEWETESLKSIFPASVQNQAGSDSAVYQPADFIGGLS